jgi:ketosteroid isomerase-like protein
MSQENVEIVHRLVEAWNEGNVDTFLGFFDHDCEVTFPPEVPEPGPFRGHAELRQWAEGFMAAWQSHHAEVVETHAARDTVVVSLHLAGRGRGSGVEMEETDAHLFTFRNGRIARWQNFVDHAEALEAVGLSEQDARADS